MPSATTPTVAPASPARARRDFERECVKLFAEVVQLFGVPKSVGQIYGLLFSSAPPLSFSDIVERLEISKGSASQGLQLLRALGAINVADPGSRSGPRNAHPSGRIAYEPELSLRRLVGGVLQERVTPLTATGMERLTQLRELAAGSDFHLDRVRQLETWRKRFRMLLPVLNALLGPVSGK